MATGALLLIVGGVIFLKRKMHRIKNKHICFITRCAYFIILAKKTPIFKREWHLK